MFMSIDAIKNKHSLQFTKLGLQLIDLYDVCIDCIGKFKYTSKRYFEKSEYKP